MVLSKGPDILERRGREEKRYRVSGLDIKLDIGG